MIKNFLSTILAAVILAVLPGCEDSPQSAGGTDPVVPETPSDPSSRPSGKTRTVLVYMVASNNLGNVYDKNDLAEMKAAASDIVNGTLLVYHVPRRAADPIRLYEIKPDGTEHVVKTYDASEPSVSVKRMRRVWADAKEYASADSYGMVLWSHGNGWLVDGMTDADAPVTFSYGQDNGKKMNTSALAVALEGQGLDFIYFDCCLMMSAEVLYDLRGCAPYIAGSVTELPVDGMRYDLNIKPFFSESPREAMIKAADNTFVHYNTQLDPADRTCSMSVVDTSKIPALAEATRLVYETSTFPAPAGYAPQRFTAPSFGKCYYFDLAHYVDAIATDTQALARWHNAIDEAVIYKNCTPRLWDEIALDTHCGISTYIFSSEQTAATKGYNTTAWYSDVASALLGKASLPSVPLD